MKIFRDTLQINRLNQEEKYYELQLRFPKRKNMKVDLGGDFLNLLWLIEMNVPI